MIYDDRVLAVRAIVRRLSDYVEDEQQCIRLERTEHYKQMRAQEWREAEQRWLLGPIAAERNSEKAQLVLPQKWPHVSNTAHAGQTLGDAPS